MTPAERLAQHIAFKHQRRLDQRNQSRNLHKDNYNESRKKQSTDLSNSDSALYKRDYRKKQQQLEAQKAHKKSKERLRKIAYRARKKLELEKDTEQKETTFRNRMIKSRAKKRVEKILPKSPKKRYSILKSLMNPMSDTCTCEKNVCDQALENARDFLKKAKKQRSDIARRTVSVISASLSDTNISESNSIMELSKKTGITPKRLSAGRKIRKNALNCNSTCFAFINRKTRKDALSETDRNIVRNFWLTPDISSPTGNKADVKRKRIGTKQYVSRAVHVLRKTQTEAFTDFKQQHPDIKIGQRLFDKLKPFQVIAVRPKDRETCCCRQHTEIRMVFKKCMEVRRQFQKQHSATDHTNFKIHENLNELVNETLCCSSGTNYDSKCLNRECESCGVENFKLMEEEIDSSRESPDVTWEKYEYVNYTLKGTNRKKLQIVKCCTKPGVLFNYLKDLLKTFPSHQFRANWQNKQYKRLTENLQVNHVVIVHDFAENYRCSNKSELQSEYFQKTEVSIHVSILHRHAISPYDDTSSSESTPNIVTEQFFVISDDPQHDRYFTYHAQKLISEYLADINANAVVMHEFTDGCSAQYKSRNCMGDVANACRELSYEKIIRNYHETSHAKGPQDAAGGFLKRQADMAVLRRKCVIQNAHDFFQFASNNLEKPKSGIYARRVFRYTKEIKRDQTFPDYKPVPQNRKIHQISADVTRPSTLSTRSLSCYECTDCLYGRTDKCNLTNTLGAFTSQKMEATTKGDIITDDGIVNDLQLRNVLSKGNVVAVIADDAEYDYYLLKVTKCPRILTSTVSDKWGNTFLDGADVLEGLFYTRTGTSLLKYKLVKRMTAIVYSCAVRYICSGISIGDNISLPECIHDDILDVTANLQF